MQHIQDKLDNSLNAMTKEEKKHLESCDKCKKDIQMLRDIEKIIENLPPRTMPLAFKMRLMSSMEQPIYKIWHMILVAMLLITSPFLMARLSVNITELYLGKNILIFSYIFISMLIVLFILPTAMKLRFLYSKELESYKKIVDNFLENGLKNFTKH